MENINIDNEKLWGKDRTRRSRLEICMSMMRVVLNGEDKPTRIMYATNTSWTTLNDYLEYLVAHGFIASTIVGKSRRFTATKECAEVLNAYNFIKEQLKTDTKEFHTFGDKYR